MDGQGTQCRRNIAENLNRLSRAHERYRQQTDGRQVCCMCFKEMLSNKPGRCGLSILSAPNGRRTNATAWGLDSTVGCKQCETESKYDFPATHRRHHWHHLRHPGRGPPKDNVHGELVQVFHRASCHSTNQQRTENTPELRGMTANTEWISSFLDLPAASNSLTSVPNTPFTRYNGLSNRLYNQFDNRLYRVNKHSTGCQTSLTTGLTYARVLFNNVKCTVPVPSNWNHKNESANTNFPQLTHQSSQHISPAITIIHTSCSALITWFDSWQLLVVHKHVSVTNYQPNSSGVLQLTR